MKPRIILPLLLCMIVKFATAQVAVNTDGSAANASAILDVKSNNLGVLIPRISTAQRTAITNPATGLFVFDTTEKTLYMFDGTQWLGFEAMTDKMRPANNFYQAPGGSQSANMAGASVSVWGQFMVIGAPSANYSTTNVNTGAAFIYQNVGSNWQLFQTLYPNGMLTSVTGFGTSVSIKGNYLAVGAPTGTNSFNNPAGAAFLYFFNGTSWGSFQTIYGSATANENFGQVVSFNQTGSAVAISAPLAAGPSNTSNSGAVYVYTYQDGGSLDFLQEITDPSPVASENFGSAMAISPNGSNLIVGAPDKTVGSYFHLGYVGLFSFGGATYSQSHTYTPPSPSNSLQLGLQVDIDSNYVLFNMAQSNLVFFFNIPGWSGYAINVGSQVNGISLDASTDKAYIFAGSTIYEAVNFGGPIAIKTLALNQTQPLQYPQLISVNNLNYVVGIPQGQVASSPQTGEFYFGVGN